MTRMMYRWLFLVPALWCGLLGASADAQVVRSGPSACKAIALTFDLCPVRNGSGYDDPLLKTLIEKQIPATFFMSGRWMDRHETEVRALRSVPFFEIGTHGQVHAHLPQLDDAHQREEIAGAVQALKATYGIDAPLFRPPYGEYNETTVALVRALGLRFILWDRISGDPDPKLSREQIAGRLTAQARNGNIIVFHANGKGLHTKDVVEDLYRDVIVAKGFRPVTVTQLLDQCPGEPAHAQRQPGR
ncbi:MAG: polysaccharide deacetylase family protein [Nitrospirota bacterium]|nr:polysaccharide deacetylase family protein [Nitrospirota bacterium]